MVFHNTWSVDGYDNLVTLVLVQCGTCSNREEYDSDSGDVEPIGDTTYDTIEEHPDCEVCGENNWERYAEHLPLGVPPLGHDESQWGVSTLREHTDELEAFTAKLDAAEEYGFYLREQRTDERTVVLWKKV